MSLPQLGRAPRSFNPSIPHLSAHLAGANLPAPPDSVDWTRDMPADLGPMLNNQINDCSCAAFYHALQVWTFNAAAGAMETEQDSNVQALYSAVSGYKMSDPAPGPKCKEQDVLAYLVKTGAPIGANGADRNKLAAFLEIDYRNLDDVKRTINEFGVAYIGIGVPAYVHANPTPQVWDVEATNNKVIGGHAVILAGYDAQGAKFISVGKTYTMTWAFFSKYTDEAYALADEAWITKKGLTPGGLTLDALKQQMLGLKG
jgi:hypothetical protein